MWSYLRVKKEGRRESQRDGSVRRNWPDAAGFEDGAKEQKPKRAAGLWERQGEVVPADTFSPSEIHLDFWPTEL